MLGVMLLFVVIINAAATGWLLAKSREMRKEIARQAQELHDVALWAGSTPVDEV